MGGRVVWPIRGAAVGVVRVTIARGIRTMGVVREGAVLGGGTPRREAGKGSRGPRHGETRAPKDDRGTDEDDE